MNEGSAGNGSAPNAGNQQVRGYRPELDAVRFMAFLLVFIHHFLLLSSSYMNSKLFSGFAGQSAWSLRLAVGETGAMGLCLFFTLSAYLITTLLMKERAKILYRLHPQVLRSQGAQNLAALLLRYRPRHGDRAHPSSPRRRHWIRLVPALCRKLLLRHLRLDSQPTDALVDHLHRGAVLSALAMGHALAFAPRTLHLRIRLHRRRQHHAFSPRKTPCRNRIQSLDQHFRAIPDVRHRHPPCSFRQTRDYT